MVTRERFYARTEPGSDGCVLWAGAVSSTGYGQCWNGTRVVGAHRLALQLEGVDLPEGKHVHHSCKTPRCVNPNHLSVIEGRVHVMRHAERDRCKNGHFWTLETLYVDPAGKRRCRLCRAEYMRRFHAKVKAA